MNKVTYQPSAELPCLVARDKKLQNWLKHIRLHLDEQSAFINSLLGPVSYSVTDYIPRALPNVLDFALRDRLRAHRRVKKYPHGINGLKKRLVTDFIPSDQN